MGGIVHEISNSSSATLKITSEPGRSIVASSAVTVYTVGTIKEIEGVRTYVAVDGGMHDNPRQLYMEATMKHSSSINQ